MMATQPNNQEDSHPISLETVETPREAPLTDPLEKQPIISENGTTFSNNSPLQEPDEKPHKPTIEELRKGMTFFLNSI